MVWVGALFVFAFSVAAISGILRAGTQATEETLTPLARRLNGQLLFSPHGSYMIEGRDGASTWRFHLSTGEDDRRFRVQPAIQGLALPAGTRLSPEGFRDSGDPQVGDPQFDALFHMQGDAAWWSAVCTADVRGLLLRQLSTGSVKMRNGEILLSVDAIRPGLLEGFDQLNALRDAMLPHARALFPLKSQVPDRLAAQAADDPLARVRRIAAGHLLSQFAMHPAARGLRNRLRAVDDLSLRALARDDEAGLVAALYDPDPPVRSAVCYALGRIGGRSSRAALVSCDCPVAPQAVARIDSRLGPPKAGSLSMAGGGELSKAMGGELGVPAPE